MSLRTLLHKKKNAKTGVKYLERKLAKLNEDPKTDPEAKKLVETRLEKKRGRLEFWATQVKESVSGSRA